MKKSKKIGASGWLIIGIVIFVSVLVAIMLLAQKSFSHKIKQITFSLSNGPVSPEFQQTTRLVLTPTSCEITITKPHTSEAKACPMDSSTFEKVQTSTNNYGVIDKLIAGNNSPGLIGGKHATVAIELQNGTIFSSTMTPQFYSDMGPYFEEVELLVPSLSQVLPSQ